ncbi:hypothetical protein SAMN06264364_11544 [Quadrisphaera granulorum]|uniref:Uncharacterized protein n=1 Tax=Quadrisphaera granulorum TaxID=317664 RepID=A0A316ASE5_9ACTN|nr:DUF6541 family protein [Quadrisphaera granulorum]PWJ53027.1 hypothetical protein BXY45_11544 [Quadrisphaera granulorum]SZE97192.1 hypothetical protein SAMN06264364_11544 [Quadrisphaera granulorum]
MLDELGPAGAPGVLLLAAAVLWAPGALLGRALGLRRRWALAGAPALTWGVVAIGAVAVPRAGLRWGPTTALGVLAMAVVVALLLRRLPLRRAAAVSGRRGRRRPPEPDTARQPDTAGGPALFVPALGCVLAAVVVVGVAWRAGHRLGSIAQTWDAVYHANLTTFIATTGDSDPVSAPSALASAGWRDVHTYYPDALHAAAALVVRLTGAGSAAVLDVVAALVAGAVLPVAVGALAGALAPTRRSVAAGVGAAVSVLPVAAPWDQWWRGVWSYGAALATGVLVVALAVRALEGRLVPHRPVSAAVAVVVATAGVAGLQPAGVVLAGVLVLGWALARLALAPLPPAHRRTALGTAVAGTLLLPPLVLALARWSPALGSLAAYDYTSRPATADGLRDTLESVLGGVRRVSPGYGFGLPPQGGQWLLAAVVLVAVVVLLTSRAAAWLAIVWVLALAAAVATVVPVAPLIGGLLGGSVGGAVGTAAADALRSVTLFFYNAPFRLMAVLGVVGAVVVGVAAARCTDLVARVLARWPLPGTGPARLVAVLLSGVLALVVAAAAVSSTAGLAAPRLAAGYAPRVTGPDQLAVMDQLARQLRDDPLPAGATVAADPVDGSAWLYARHDVPVLFRHYSAGPLTPPAQLLLQSLRDVDTDADVRQALRDLRVCYVYSSGVSVYDSSAPAPGFTDLDGVAALEPVARAGSAAAYRVLVPGTPCAPS